MLNKEILNEREQLVRKSYLEGIIRTEKIVHKLTLKTLYKKFQEKL